jgi:sphinganine-1-phosphate aldolase
VFSSVRRFEAEIIRMTARIMRGDQDTCGVVTSGGTDSLFMAVKTYRDRALALFGITEPEVVMPVTAHPAFDKAAEYLCVKLVKIDLDPNTLRVDLNAVKRAINRNTILVVGSAPNYPHGVVDDIEGLSQLLDQIDPRHSARVGRIGLHVDSCLGGFVLPWALREGNYGVPTFDFAVARVTSISADTHKYGFAPKGTSVLLFRDKSIREHMFFVATDWSGGIYASPSLAGSRPGALLACTWAVMLYNGDEGYNNSALQIMNTQRALVKAIQDNEHATGLRVLGLPTSPVVAFTFNSSTKLDVFKVNDAMSRRHWHLDALQQPSAVHLCVTMRHVGREQEFMKDLIDSVAEVRAMPKDEQFAGGSAPMYGVVASLPDRSLITDFAHRYLATMLDA